MNDQVTRVCIYRTSPQADPVSIALALSSERQTHEGEGRIAYGFKRRPIEQRTIKTHPNIPEENLFNLHGKVIEFKKPKQSEECGCDCEEDGSDEDSQTVDQQETNTVNKQCYSYSDIGYAESTGNERKFVNVPISTTPKPRVAPVLNGGQIITLDDPCDHVLSEYRVYYNCGHQESMT